MEVTDDDLSNEAIPFSTAREIAIAGAPVLAQRITFVGELGFELYVAPEWAVQVWDRIWAAGEAHGIRAGGYRVLESLRIEKGYRYFGSDLTRRGHAIRRRRGVLRGRGQAVHRRRGARPGARARSAPPGAHAARRRRRQYLALYGGEAVRLDGARRRPRPQLRVRPHHPAERRPRPAARRSRRSAPASTSRFSASRFPPRSWRRCSSIQRTPVSTNLAASLIAHHRRRPTPDEGPFAMPEEGLEPPTRGLDTTARSAARHSVVRRIERQCGPEVTVRSRDEPCSSPSFDQLLRFVSLRSGLVEFRLEGIVDWGRTARISRRARRLEAMNTHRTGQSDVHRRHLCLVAPVSPEIRLSRREVRAMSRVAALLRRRAARLPADSLLRAELMEAAEYYATGADQASTGHSRHAPGRDWGR